MTAINEEAYRRLEDVIGADQLRALLADCVHDLEQIVTAIVSGVAVGDGAAVKRMSHKMAGVLAQFACLEPARAARALSQSSDSEALAGASDLLAQCQTAIDKLHARAREGQ